jgi:hypothetical protein
VPKLIGRALARVRSAWRALAAIFDKST